MSKGIKKVLSFALPIVGSIFGGPIGAAVGGAAGGALSGGGVKGALIGGVTGYLGGGGLGAPAGASLATTTGNAALQGPTFGAGVQGLLTGGGARALAAPVTSAATGVMSRIPNSLLLNGVSGLVGDINEEAALKAARQQREGILEGINANQAALEPYTQLGSESARRISEIQADPAAYIKSNGLYGSLAADAERRLLANQAAKGKVGSGGTAAALQEQLLNIGTGLVNNEIGNLQNQVGIGANAAGQVGNLSYQGGTNVGNTNAAGTIGANAALTAAYQNQINTILASQNLNKTPTYYQPLNL